FLMHARAFLGWFVVYSGDVQDYRVVFVRAGYLPLLAPWMLVLAVPSIALNVLSSDPNMRSGIFQYNAEIVPILIFATIEAIVLITWLVQWSIKRLHLPSEKVPSGRVSIAVPQYLG